MIGYSLKTPEFPASGNTQKDSRYDGYVKGLEAAFIPSNTLSVSLILFHTLPPSVIVFEDVDLSFET